MSSKHDDSTHRDPNAAPQGAHDAGGHGSQHEETPSPQPDDAGGHGSQHAVTPPPESHDARGPRLAA